MTLAVVTASHSPLMDFTEPAPGVRDRVEAAFARARSFVAAFDPEQRAPTGAQLKAWLLGGQTIPASLALFDVEASGLVTIGIMAALSCSIATVGW